MHFLLIYISRIYGVRSLYFGKEDALVFISGED